MTKAGATYQRTLPTIVGTKVFQKCCFSQIYTKPCIQKPQWAFWQFFRKMSIWNISSWCASRWSGELSGWVICCEFGFLSNLTAQSDLAYLFRSTFWERKMNAVDRQCESFFRALKTSYYVDFSSGMMICWAFSLDTGSCLQRYIIWFGDAWLFFIIAPRHLAFVNPACDDHRNEHSGKKSGKSVSVYSNFMKSRMSIAMVRATHLCIRESRLPMSRMSQHRWSRTCSTSKSDNKHISNGSKCFREKIKIEHRK